MSNAIIGLLGALVGGLAAFGGAWLQAYSAARRAQEEAVRQEKRRQEEREAQLHDRRRLVARRYLYQLGDAVDSFLHRVENWAHRGGPCYSEGLHPGYWEITSLYVLARALGAERLMALEGVYIDLQAFEPREGPRLDERAIENATSKAFGHGLFYYHRLALGEAVLDREGDEFRLLTYSEFVRRYEDPVWNLKTLLEPVRGAFASLTNERLQQLEASLTGLSKTIRRLSASSQGGLHEGTGA